MRHNWKPIREWFNELPEPFHSQAVRNATRDMLEAGLDPEKEFNELEPSKYDALSKSFIWMSSPEGDTYWRNIAEVDEKLN